MQYVKNATVTAVETFAGLVDVSVAGSEIIEAASAEHTTRDKWVKAARKAYKAGVRVEMITKGTKDEPNDSYCEALHAAILSYCVQGVSASKKGQRYDSPRPDADGADVLANKAAAFTWTISDMLALTADDLRSIEDDKLKGVRRQYKQYIDGPVFTRMRTHIDNIQNPDKAKGAKGKKTADAGATDAGFDLRTGEGFLGAVNGGLAGLAHWCGSAHRDALDNAARQLIELLRAATK